MRLIVELFSTLLFMAALTCSLVTGFVTTYAVVVMPGLSKLSDKEFLRAFQITDKVIQNKHPLFMLIWLGSIVFILGAMFSSIVEFGLFGSLFIIFLGVLYLLGVQGLTITIHLPLNNRLQAVDIENLTSEELYEERFKFEMKWNYFNKIRSFIAFFVTLMLLIFLMMI